MPLSQKRKSANRDNKKKDMGLVSVSRRYWVLPQDVENVKIKCDKSVKQELARAQKIIDKNS